MSDVLYGNLVDEQPLQGRMIDKVIAFEKYDDTEVKAGIAANKAAIEALDTKVDTNIAAAKAELNTAIGNTNNAVTALETKHDADQAQNVVDHNELHRMNELAGRKIQALTDLLNGKELAFDTQEYNANPVDVPNGAVADSVLKIGGKSIVWNQYALPINNSATNKTENGLTISTSGDGIYKINGTASSNTSFVIDYSTVKLLVKDVISADHKLLFLGIPSGCSYSTYRMSIAWYDENRAAFYDNYVFENTIISPTKDIYSWYVSFYISSGQTLNNLTFKPQIIDLTKMFGAGNEPTTVDDPRIKAIEQYAEAHPEYNEGEIISSQTDEVVVRGANLFDESILTSQGWVIKDGYYYVQYPSTVHTKKVYSGKASYVHYEVYHEHASSQGARLRIVCTDGTIIVPSLNAQNKWYTCDFVINPTKVVDYIDWDYGGNSASTRVRNIMICENSTATSYLPYSKQTIPTNLPQLFENDYIDFKNNELHRNAWAFRVRAENITGQYRETNHSVRISQPYPIKADGNSTGILACIGAEKCGFETLYNGLNSDFEKFTISTHGSANGNLYACMSGLTTVEQYKEYVEQNEVMVVYAMVEPIITDIDPLPQLEAINVESGGEIRFVDHSEMALPIPSTHEWIVRNAEV